MRQNSVFEIKLLGVPRHAVVIQCCGCVLPMFERIRQIQEQALKKLRARIEARERAVIEDPEDVSALAVAV